MVQITEKEYARLLKADATLEKLYAGGVDNWEWYGACFEDDEEEEEDESIIS